MTKLESTPAAAVLVAIDIAKVRNEVLIEASGHRRRRRLRLAAELGSTASELLAA